MQKHSWDRKTVVLTLLGGAFVLGVAVPVSAEEAPRPGWSLMSPEEMAEHREVMRTLEGDELRQYREAHHESMRARAAEQGVTLREGRGSGRGDMSWYRSPPMEPGMDPRMGRSMEPGMMPRMGRGLGPCAEPGAGPRQGRGPGQGPGMGYGPGMGQGYGPGMGHGPGMGQGYGPGPGMGYGSGQGYGPGPGYGPGTGQGPWTGPWVPPYWAR
jgi:hypothetical protein